MPASLWRRVWDELIGANTYRPCLTERATDMNSSDRQTEIVSRVLNQAGAEVHVLGILRWKWSGWQCTACRQGLPVESHHSFIDMNAEAARHAETCRFLPAS